MNLMKVTTSNGDVYEILDTNEGFGKVEKYVNQKFIQKTIKTKLGPYSRRFKITNQIHLDYIEMCVELNRPIDIIQLYYETLNT